MAYESYVKIAGTTQTTINGESPRDKWKDWIPVLNFQHNIEGPIDVSTGGSTGSAKHGSITFTKQWGAATPQLLNAVHLREMLATLEFVFRYTPPEGGEQDFYKITLTNAYITNIKYYQSAMTKDIGSTDVLQLEDVSVSYDKIQHDHVPASATGSASWVSEQ